MSGNQGNGSKTEVQGIGGHGTHFGLKQNSHKREVEVDGGRGRGKLLRKEEML